MCMNNSFPRRVESVLSDICCHEIKVLSRVISHGPGRNGERDKPFDLILLCKWQLIRAFLMAQFGRQADRLLALLENSTEAGILLGAGRRIHLQDRPGWAERQIKRTLFAQRSS